VNAALWSGSLGCCAVQEVPLLRLLLVSTSETNGFSMELDDGWLTDQVRVRFLCISLELNAKIAGGPRAI
jgi:hypothetical protein